MKDPTRALELLPQLGEDESPEDWIGEEFLLAVGRAAEGNGGDLDALQEATNTLAGEAEVDLNKILAEYGLEVSTPELEFSESEDD